MKKLVLVLLACIAAQLGYGQSLSYDEMDKRFTRETLTRPDTLSFIKSAESNITYFISIVRAYAENADDELAGLYAGNLMSLLDSSTRINAGPMAFSATDKASCIALLGFLSNMDAIKDKGTRINREGEEHLATYRYTGSSKAIEISADLRRVRKDFGKDRRWIWEVAITEIRVVPV